MTTDNETSTVELSTAVTVSASYVAPVEVSGKSIDDLVSTIQQQEGGEARLQRARQRLSSMLAAKQPQSIRTMRLNAGLSQTQLAELTGLSQPQIATIERPNSNPTIDTLKKIAEALGVRVSAVVAQWDNAVAEEK
ncbi:MULTISPECIES: helix-turn-helix transcriptional regulator [Ralstonia]|nr:MULTISPECIES: helix-turn-helix transcriptional regulator [Ralstonia]MBL4778722.1 helix-turn-helix transcriptional regulator [Ralstonia sp.]MCM3583364.1 helix-turn-helix domain-containing protein [Ralstonia pickettii]MDR9387007.1 helix-turn-helix transcriptional regulator [Ralstonia sp. 11b]